MPPAGPSPRASTRAARSATADTSSSTRPSSTDASAASGTSSNRAASSSSARSQRRVGERSRGNLVQPGFDLPEVHRHGTDQPRAALRARQRGAKARLVRRHPPCLQARPQRRRRDERSPSACLERGFTGMASGKLGRNGVDPRGGFRQPGLKLRITHRAGGQLRRDGVDSADGLRQPGLSPGSATGRKPAPPRAR